MSKRKSKDSQLGTGTGHFWFLFIMTVICALIGLLVKGWWAALALGALMYASPIFASLKMGLSKQDLSRFYTFKSRDSGLRNSKFPKLYKSTTPSSFESNSPSVFINDLGDFKYFDDEDDQYWTLTSQYQDKRSSVDIDFLALSGSSLKVNSRVEKFAKKLLNNPNLLWGLLDHLFIDSASEDINEISIDNAKEHFFIKSLAIENEDSFEVGFHALELDVFLELFVVKGKAFKIEKDYGCCE